MEGKLIIEIYEYEEDSMTVPTFRFIPCELSKCLRGKNATLKEIVQRGFDELPKKAQDQSMRQEMMRRLSDAGIGIINVEFQEGKGGDPCVRLTNVVRTNMTDSDARALKPNKDSIILKERYQLSTGNEVTTLKDAQRLTLIYRDGYDKDDLGENALEREICLNITYLQNA